MFTYLAKDRIVLGVELSLGILNLLLLLLVLLLLLFLLLGKCTAPKLLLFSSVLNLAFAAAGRVAVVVATAVGAAATRSPVVVTSISSSGIVVVVVVVAPAVGVLPVVGVVLMGRDPSLRILLLKKRIINLSFSGQLAYLSGNFTYIIPLKKCLFFIPSLSYFVYTLVCTRFDDIGRGKVKVHELNPIACYLILSLKLAVLVVVE